MVVRPNSASPHIDLSLSEKTLSRNDRDNMQYNKGVQGRQWCYQVVCQKVSPTIVSRRRPCCLDMQGLPIRSCPCKRHT
ncbi:hypothetical protein J6590_052339 [Homalodisca vitripennis]|nr:hypothetical protein J6590_052339 [Homalodisca vitripennis]